MSRSNLDPLVVELSRQIVEAIRSNRWEECERLLAERESLLDAVDQRIVDQVIELDRESLRTLQFELARTRDALSQLQRTSGFVSRYLPTRAANGGRLHRVAE